jgi:hypothetical protein
MTYGECFSVAAAVAALVSTAVTMLLVAAIHDRHK